MNRKKDLDWVETAVDKAIQKYVDSRKDRISGFVKEHFSFPGALVLNRKAIGSDLYKAPLNMIWLPPYTVLKASSALLKKVGFQRVSSRIENMPMGFTTDVQKEVTWLIFTGLLEIPYVQGKRKSNKDALLQIILDQPKISSFLAIALSRIYSKSRDPEFRFVLEKNLSEYSKSRTAAADLAGSLISLSAGATMFHQMTPGALSTGGALAAAIAQQTAISNFVLGPTLGSLYYGVFPASASVTLLTVSTGTVLAALAVTSSFSGIITDPIQYRLEIHERRLNRLIDSIEKALKGVDNEGFKIRDHYVVRIFDLFDLIMKAARTAV